MPEVIRPSLTFSHVALRAYGKRSSALSSEGSELSEQLEFVCIRFEGVTTYANARMDVIAILDAQILENLNSSVVSEEVAPALFASYTNAKEFLMLLPSRLPDPEVAIEPADGAISLEWHFGYRRVFSVSIGESKRFAFAGLDGTDRVHGVSEFDEEEGIAPRVLVERVDSIARWRR